MKPASVVLAAGLGTRMKSDIPKVLHPLFAKPMVQYVVEALMALKPEKTIVVIGGKGERIRDTLRNYPVSFAVQKGPKGDRRCPQVGVTKTAGLYRHVTGGQRRYASY